jgi:hypothetical protein
MGVQSIQRIDVVNVIFVLLRINSFFFLMEYVKTFLCLINIGMYI